MPDAPRMRTRTPADWENRYTSGDMPWDVGHPDPFLAEVFARHAPPEGPVAEIGCGTGTNAGWLAAQGREVVAVDLSPTAVAMARAKVGGAASIRVEQADFLADGLPGGPFAFVYDRGVFHVFDDEADRARFAARVAAQLLPDGLWHSLLGSTDGPPRDVGPPRRSVLDVGRAVEPALEILRLEAVDFDVIDRSAQAWLMVARKRRTWGG
jgi:SAM-dependent methyltransferase